MLLTELMLHMLIGMKLATVLERMLLYAGECDRLIQIAFAFSVCHKQNIIH